MPDQAKWAAGGALAAGGAMLAVAASVDIPWWVGCLIWAAISLSFTYGIWQALPPSRAGKAIGLALAAAGWVVAYNLWHVMGR